MIYPAIMGTMLAGYNFGNRDISLPPGIPGISTKHLFMTAPSPCFPILAGYQVPAVQQPYDS